MTGPYYSNPSGSQQQFPNMLTPVEDPDVEEHRRKVKRWGIIILILLIILGLVFISWLYGTVQNNKDNAVSSSETSSTATTHRSSSGGTAVAGTASRSSTTSSRTTTSATSTSTSSSTKVTATPVSTLAGAPLAEIIDDPNATPSQKEATQRAQVYVNQQLTSKKELFYQLTSINGISPTDAQYALEHLKVDYRKVAEQEALVLEASGYTKEEIEEMLKSTEPLGKKFTAEEAKYAVQRLK